MSSDGEELGRTLEALRPRMERMVSFRFDPRLSPRLGVADVVQSAYVEALRRLDEYRKDAAIPFFLWVRLLCMQKLAEVHRRHLGAEMRDVRREVGEIGGPEATSVSLARAIAGRGSSPSRLAMRAEREERLREALDRVTYSDREILMLRHFEQLTIQECACVLGLSKSGARLRHVRAAKRLREALKKSDFFDEISAEGGCA